MRQAIGDVLPLAIAAAISPFPIIGVVLMLVTPRGRVNGSMFILGWIAGLVVVGAIGLAIAGGSGASDHGSPSDTANLFQIGLGTALLVFAIRAWRKRPKADEEPTMLIAGLEIRILSLDGTQLRRLTLDPTRDYQPMSSL